MRDEPKWLTADDLVRINQRLVQIHFLRDCPALEAAVAGPKHSYFFSNEPVDLLTLGVKLLESVVRAHAFQDGNKRVAFHSMKIFLENNGCVVALPDDQKVGKWIEQLVTHEITAEELDHLLRPFIVMPPS